MFKSIAYEALYGVKSTVNSFNNKYPNAQVISSSATNFSELKGQSRMGIARRGVVIFTEEQVFFKSVLLSLYSFIYLFLALTSFWMFFRFQSFYNLIAGFIVGAMIIQRLPLQRQILIKDINEVEFDSAKGSLLTGGKIFYRLKLVVDDKIMFFGMSQTLPDEIKQKLGIEGSNSKQSTG